MGSQLQAEFFFCPLVLCINAIAVALHGEKKLLLHAIK